MAIRCAHCGSPDMAAGTNMYHCYTCGKLTEAATRRGPLEGLHYNDDALDAACRDWMRRNAPEALRLLADTVAGQPDPGSEVGGLQMVMPEEPTPAEEPLPETPEPEPTTPEPEPTPEPEAVA